MNYHEYFEISTEGGRCYLVEAVNAAHAAYHVEQQYQDRVIEVCRHEYHKIILIGDDNNGSPETPESNTETPSSDPANAGLTLTAEESEADSGQEPRQEDV